MATPRQRRVVALRRALRASRAESAARARAWLEAGHDLRQPLHALSLQAGALAAHARQRGDDTLATLAAEIDTTTARSLRLVDGLLDSARLDSGGPAPAWATVDLLALLQGVAREFAPIAAQRGLGLAVWLDGQPAAPGPSPVPVRTDPDLLRRLLHNLVANALAYTAQGGVQLRLNRGAAGDRPGAEGPPLAVVVADTGVGMAPAELARLCQPYQRGVAASSAQAGGGAGLGLGLAIAQRLAAQLGLAWQLHSAPGAGTQVRLAWSTSAAAAP